MGGVQFTVPIQNFARSLNVLFPLSYAIRASGPASLRRGRRMSFDFDAWVYHEFEKFAPGRGAAFTTTAEALLSGIGSGASGLSAKNSSTAFRTPSHVL